ncbi:MAG: phosphomannomutase/phosphoglucomutase [Cellulomonadaceae bacterium]|jgi:phosphomannomutase|nr:phosphomannomutase/phosphoglucomutase [Cellulomonadaceae bacterium]
MTMDLSTIIKAYDVRGVVPDELSPQVAEAVGAAFARIVVLPLWGVSSPEGTATSTGTAAPAASFTEPMTGAPTVVVGNDMRASCDELIAAYQRGVTNAGVNVVRIGLCSTDGLYFAAGSLNLPGAMFTASHNPARYNGIKQCYPGAKPVGEASGLAEIRTLAQHYLAKGLPEPVAQPGTVTEREMLAEYGAHLRSLVDISGIRPLKVVVDAGNGMGGYTAPAVLGTAAGLPELPLEIIPLYFELDGSFPNHEANPLDPANLVDLQRAVVENKADIGLAFDGDADRCFVVDEQGHPVSGSVMTLLIGLREVARLQGLDGDDREERPWVIHNVITSRAVPEMLQAAGAQTIRSRVGHSFIKAQMAQYNAIFGGEHSGHFYFRDFWFADTGMLSALHVLAALGGQEHPLSALAEMYQPYSASGEINSVVSSVAEAKDRVVAAYRAAYPDCNIDDLDGTTVVHWNSQPRFWFNLRPSNTEPLLRLNVEAVDEDIMEKVRDDVLSIVRGEDAGRGDGAGPGDGADRADDAGSVEG